MARRDGKVQVGVEGLAVGLEVQGKVKSNRKTQVKERDGDSAITC